MGRANQGGSILSFVIIGGVLMALLVGGAYMVQQQSAQSEKEDAPVAVQPDETPKQEKPTDSSEEPKKETEKPASEQENSSETTPVPAPVATPAPASPRSSTELPQAGPVETLSSLVGLGLLSAASVAYVRSRRI